MYLDANQKMALHGSEAGRRRHDRRSAALPSAPVVPERWVRFVRLRVHGASALRGLAARLEAPVNRYCEPAMRPD